MHISATPPPTEEGARHGPRGAHRYDIRGSLAAGGMGVVYRATDRVSGEVRALKRIRPGGERSGPAYLAAFEREYQVLASLEHPRIIRVYEYGVDSEGPYYVMELVEGPDLERAAPVPWRKACLYLRELAGTLSLLHARRLLHRDLSPGNVKLTPDGHCKLLDFGALAPFGRPRWIVGTPPMIAPEALAGGILDQRSDLYALGAVAYWMITGTHAYPARRIDDLPTFWESAPAPPSGVRSDVPEALDRLIMSLLSADPLARPTSAAAVIMHLDAIADLEPESASERLRLAESFLRTPPFAGRRRELAVLEAHIATLVRGSGMALRVEAAQGSGRTRLLEEVGIRAQIAGATVLRVDASAHPGSHGTSRALALRLLEALPDLARERGKKYGIALGSLGSDVADAIGVHPARPSQGALPERPSQRASELEAWFTEIAHEKTLTVQVDNVEYADDVSLGLLLTLARSAAEHPLMLVVSERLSRDQPSANGLLRLREQCSTLALADLSAAESLELAQGLFGDAPNIERYSEWLHGQTAGSPLHFLELTRELVSRNLIRLEGGIWILPATRPHMELPEALGDALWLRVHGLGDAARSLAQCLSLTREQPTFALCRLVMADQLDGDLERETLSLLDELAQRDVLYAEQSSYRFSSAALRDALLLRLDPLTQREAHLRLGRAFSALAREEDHELRLEAGWHLIQGGRDEEGADVITRVFAKTIVVRTLQANLVRVGAPAAAALRVYNRARRDIAERLPLLGVLSYVGFFEDFETGERYGDQAMDGFEQLAGIRLARRLRFLGRLPALGIALLLALLSFYALPKRKRLYSFYEMLVHLCGTAFSETVRATLSLDADRAARAADMLEPFSVLPRWLAPVGMYDLCVAIQQVAREHQAETYGRFDALAGRFSNPRWYRELPPDTRIMAHTGCHFGRAAFAIFRYDGRAALESADVLDASGMKLFAMIASQLRQLYHLNRGELSLALPHRENVEVHAAHVGTAWQVELWEPAALLPLYIALGDVVALKRAALRIAQLAPFVPGMQRYARLARLAVSIARGEHVERLLLRVAEHDLLGVPPRSYIGWGVALGTVARAYNTHGRYAEARALCEVALTSLRDEDRDYVSLFLDVDIQAAHADAGLGHTDAALARVEALLSRFELVDSPHPLALVLLHEARAQIASRVGRVDLYELSLREATRWARHTGTPALIAKCDRLAELERPAETARARRPALLETPTETTMMTEDALIEVAPHHATGQPHS